MENSEGRSDKSEWLPGYSKRSRKKAKELSANSGGGEVRIHGLDGKIRDSDTVEPGNDPTSSKDTKN